MTAIVLLFGLGIVLLTFEVVVPGGVLGVLGGLAMLGGCALAFYEYGAGGGGIAVGVALACLALGLFIEFRVLPRTRYGRKLFLNQAVDATSQPLPADATIVVGKFAEAVTVMAPSGYVTIDGRRYDAFSQSGLIAKGATVRVVAVDNFHLIVAKT
ncbi:MAG TPA: NfeD family protein [Opitutus sp.]|nr:NfeD family protein [Opitutus sp.]